MQFQRPGDLLPESVLDSAQQFRLADIAQALQRFETAQGAVVLGLIDAREWPWGWTCPPPSFIGAYAREFDLSAAQVTQLEQLEQAARQPIVEQGWAMQKRHRELLDSGASENSPEVTQLMAEISELMKQYAAIRPPHDAALALLTGMQRARLAAFEADLELAREAVELRLVVAPWPGEALCH
jgi:Ser/Thr protein kinase RdoA (MazF antagonist)